MRTESARSVMKAYWEKKKAGHVATSEGGAAAGGVSADAPMPTSQGGVSARVSAVTTCSEETAAAHRLKLLTGKLSPQEDVSDDNALVVISVGRLKELLSGNSCDVCGEQSQTDIKRKYFDCEVKVKCTTCDLVLCDSKPRTAEIGNFPEANSVLVFHSISNGYGRAGLSKLSALFGTTDMPQSVFMNYANALYCAMDDFYKEQQNIVLETVREVHTKKDTTVVQSADKIDAGVGYDGTWMTRGHKSHIQVGFVIEMATGFVLDFDIISNYCRSCSINKKMKTKEAFEAWRETVHAGKCQANFDGLSGRMEAECAVRLWERSEDIGFYYTTFLGDGDSSAYTSVTKMNDGEGPTM